MMLAMLVMLAKLVRCEACAMLLTHYRTVAVVTILALAE